jgi:RNA-binding protein YhbY
MNEGTVNTEGTTPRAVDPEPSPDATAEEIKRQIGQTRSELGDTISAIEQKLNPTVLREKAVEELQVVEEKVKEVVHEKLLEAKATIKVELAEAKEHVKQEVKEALAHAKQAVRAATIGKVETMARRANETTIEVRDSLFDTLWHNPLPTALAGIGLTWLYMNRKSASAGSSSGGGYYGESDWRRPSGARNVAGDISSGVGGALRGAKDAASRAVHGVENTASDLATSAGNAAGNVSRAAGQLGQQVGQVAHDAVDAAGDLAHRVSEGVTQVAHDAGEMGAQAAAQARYQARRVDESIRQVMQTNPLAVGATMVAAGALVGLALPRTRREDDLMGETSDQLMERARGVAHDAVGAARELAHHGLEEAKAAVESATHR